jgi:Holliday junction resolvasome RuvABC ATP-dependent DNA helicase subunit
MDGQNKGRSIPYSADEYTVFDRSKKVVIIATNYREKINPALLSRMDDIILEAYSDAELQAIAIKMLADNELIADNELTIEILAKASRGTARPLFNLVTHLTRKDIPDNTVTIHDAVQAMAELNQYPFGLNRDEVTLLDKAKKSYSRNIAVIALTSLEKCYNKTISYLETRGLLAIQSNGDVLTTKKGKAYLAKLSELGFNV